MPARTDADPPGEPSSSACGGPSTISPVVVLSSSQTPVPRIHIQHVDNAVTAVPGYTSPAVAPSLQSPHAPTTEPVVAQNPAAPDNVEQELAISIYNTIEQLRIAQAEISKKRWVYTDKNGEQVQVVERIGRILRGVEHYSKVVGVAINHDPIITALVWAGCKLILMVCTPFFLRIVYLVKS